MVKVPVNGTIDEIVMKKIEKLMKQKQWGLSFVINKKLRESFGVVDNE